MLGYYFCSHRYYAFLSVLPHLYMVTMASEAPQTKGQLRNTAMANTQALGILSIPLVY